MMAEKKPAAKKPAVKKEPAVVSEVQVFRDNIGDWHWRALAANHRIIATSGEGYRNRMYAHKMARELHPGANVYFVA
jgi:uncharacterized protein YegP (UPF0339 family)